MNKETLKAILTVALKYSKIIVMVGGWVVAALTFLLLNLDNLPL